MHLYFLDLTISYVLPIVPQETGEWESTFWKMLEESKCDDWSFQGHTI
jgi:hypothetical protein